MELKYNKLIKLTAECTHGSNRTFMELKLFCEKSEHFFV